MSTERDRKCQEREKLKNIIVQWNANRLDLFALSEPNEELEFHGVMRFYFQDAGQKVATKCIRVSSTASTQDCVETLIEKFRPDIRMLSVPEYALYEIHENGDERKLNEEEKPLLVQLNWHKDDREGRFLLKRMDEKSYLPSIPEANSFRRKLSKREKKEKKRREKKERIKSSEENKRDGIAERLYSEIPETSFTRSISNPEAVMRRRRQQKLEKKLQQFRQEGGTDAGGTLRIFGENLNKDVPYKTLLLSTKDTAAYVVKEILEKYGHDKEDPTQYCLVQAIIPASSLGCEEELQEYHSSIPGVREYILDDDDCPLAIERQHNRTKGILVFHVKRRPADYQPRKRKKKPKPTKGELEGGYRYEDLERLPYLLELNPDGSDIHGTPKKHRLYLNVTEVGSERSSSTGGQCLQLFGPNVQPRHCVIAHTESIITVTPSSRDAETYVNGARIYETTILQHGMVVRFGKLHTFRFVDPIHDQKQGLTPDIRPTAEFLDRNARKEDQLSGHHGGYETTFDADGNVETVSTHSKDDRMSRKSDDAHSHRSLGRESSQGHGSYEKFDQRCGNDPIMPALLEFWEEGEDTFLSAIITQLDSSQVQFKVAPTYTLYMAARYRASTHFRPETTPSDRAHRLTALMNKVASMIHQVIQDRYREAGSLAFWLANASELLHFLKQDRHLSAYTLDAQDMLAESVQLAFRSLVTCQQGELLAAMPAFLEDRDDVSEEEGTTADVLAVLSSAMSLLRRCRVNAALTIQLFSQLFHYINMWLFNQVVNETRPNLCTRLWGVRFKRRLARIESWAEKQGLELAADCHLSRIVQAAHLLQAPKSSPDDIASISSSCFKLNSLQLFTLLERYRPVPDEPHIPRDLIESVVKVAENTADELARSDGREIKLDEDSDLQLPFLLPEDGYSCDIVRGVPTGLQEFLQPLVQTGLCHLSIQTSSSGYWTIYMSDQDIGHFPPRACSPSTQSHVGDGEGSGRGSTLPPEPEVSTIRLQKSNNGIGLSIVAAGGVDQDKLGIYVKSVVKGGAADLDGRLQAGDQLLKVDGQSLVGISQEKAAELMTRTGPVVTLEVAKQGAIYHGLQALLSKPSPVMPRGGHRMSERDIPSRVMHDPSYDPRFLGVPGARIQSSKSVPSLNSGHSAQEAVRQTTNTNSRSHEVYNPAYSRTSSTTSIPKATEFPGPIHSDSANRSKSANNLRQEALPPSDRYPYVPSGQCPPPAYSAAVGPLGNRPVSQPNLQQQQQIIQEERHYQNISMYQQPNNHSLPRPAPQQYSQHQQSQTKTIHGSHSSLNRSEHQQLSAQSSLERSRPLSTLVSPREQEQYVNSLGYIHGSGSALPPPPPSPHRTQSGHTGSDFRLPPQGHGQRTSDGREFHGHPEHFINEIIPENVPVEDHFRGLPPNYNHSHLQPQHPDSRQRDIIRQEAKMEEMREEVRRREERERLQQSSQVWPSMRSPQPGALTQQNRQIPTAYSGPTPYGSLGAPQNTRSLTANVPPPALKPRPHPGSEKIQRQYGNNNRYDNTLEGQMVFQDPSSVALTSNAHSLLTNSHQRAPPPAVSYRYGPSGYPPRLADTQQNSGRPIQSDPRLASPFPKQSMIQSAQGQRQVVFDNLHSPATGQLASQDKKDMSTLASPSPWEREEKEKLQKQRLEEARHVRDEEIRELENLQRRNPKQEERLRTLRLEKEFQRRAEELHGDEEEEEDEELLDRAESRERMLKMQEDLERARQRRLEWEQEQQQKHAILTPQEEWKRRQQDRQHSQIEEQEGRLKQLRLEEVNRKKELEAAKEVEEQLLREARRRQDEENRIQRTLQQQQQRHTPNVLPPYGSQPSVNVQARTEMAMNNQHDIPPPLPTSPPPVEPGYNNHFNQTNTTHELAHPLYGPARSSGSQRLDTLLLVTPVSKSLSLQQNSSYSDKSLGPPPAPPERKSSYEVTNHMSSNSRLTNTSSLRNGDGGSHPHQPKKVSFHDSQLETEVTYDANGNHNQDENNVQSVIPSGQEQIQINYTTNSGSQSYTLQDIDEVLATPHNSQNLNTYSAGSTPGVIGAQEIYRDPRQRIEAERLQHHFEYGKSTGPEKLTFREKMKMFAMETGQQESPKDKVKISRAQRDIETNLNGT